MAGTVCYSLRCRVSVTFDFADTDVQGGPKNGHTLFCTL